MIRNTRVSALSGLQKYCGLFFAMILLLVGRLTLGEDERSRLLLDGVETILLMTAVLFVTGHWRRSLKALLIAFPGLIATWIDWFITSPLTELVRHFFLLLLLGYVLSVVVSDILTEVEIDVEHLLAAASGYLLIGLSAASLFEMIEIVRPMSFVVTTSAPAQVRDLSYFSFTTLMTIGYGDIFPVGRLARVVAVLESMLGQFYLVFVMSRLVGLHTAHLVSGQPARALATPKGNI